MGVSVRELQDELVANEPSCTVQLVLGDRVLDRNEMISEGECSDVPVTVLCVFSKEVRINAKYSMGVYRGEYKAQLSVEPCFGSDFDEEAWLKEKSDNVVNSTGAEILNRLRLSNVDPAKWNSIRQGLIISKSTTMSPGDWVKLETFLEFAGNARLVEWLRLRA